MKKILLLLALTSPFVLSAQSRTTEELQKKFEGSFSMFFYKNTLRMLNQQDSKELDDLVKNIEKMRFLIIDKAQRNFGQADYRKLLNGYASEAYEPIMKSRYDGKNFDIYLRDKNGSTLGTVVIVNDSTNLYVLDILGTIDVSKASKLFSSIDGSSEITQKVKSFMDHDGNHHRDNN